MADSGAGPGLACPQGAVNRLSETCFRYEENSTTTSHVTGKIHYFAETASKNRVKRQPWLPNPQRPCADEGFINF